MAPSVRRDLRVTRQWSMSRRAAVAVAVAVPVMLVGAMAAPAGDMVVVEVAVALPTTAIHPERVGMVATELQS